jgi:hypothetical protein
MELSIRSLTEQVKTLTAQRSGTPYHVQSHRSSPVPIPVHLRQPTNNYPQMDKMANINTWQQMSSAVKPDMPSGQGMSTVPPQPHHQTSLPAAPISQQNQYNQPQAIQPLAMQAQQPQVPQYRHETPTEDWEKIFLQALSNPDIRALRDVLAYAPADKVMPLNGTLLVTQTIILSVIHKVFLFTSISNTQGLTLSLRLLGALLMWKPSKRLSLYFGGLADARKCWMHM